MFHFHNFSLPVAPHLSPSAQQIINFTAEEGSLSWVIGPAGSGKSLLLETLALRRRVSSRQTGSLTIFNYPITSKITQNLSTHLKRHMSVIDGSKTLQMKWTVLDNLLLPLRLSAMSQSDMQREVTPILKWLNLTPYQETPIPRLSHALQQRVSVACALVNRPALLLVDIDSLEAPLQHLLLPAFSAMQRSGCTLLLTSAEERHLQTLPAPVLSLPCAPSALDALHTDSPHIPQRIS